MKRSIGSKQTSRWLATFVAIGALALTGCGRNNTPAAVNPAAVNPNQFGNWTGGFPGFPGGGGFFPPGTQMGCASLMGPISFVGQNIYFSSINLTGYGAVTGAVGQVGVGGGLVLSRGFSDGLSSVDGAIQLSVASQNQFNGQFSLFPQGVPQTPFSPFAQAGSPLMGMGYPQWPGNNIGGVIAQGTLQLSQAKLQQLAWQMGQALQTACVNTVALDLGHVNFNGQQVVWGTVLLQITMQNGWGAGFGSSAIVYVTF